MNDDEFYKEMDAAGVPRDSYSLQGGLPNEAYCIELVGSKWVVYYSERGNKNFFGEFKDRYLGLLFLGALLNKESE